MAEVALGDKVRDKVTGFEGIAVARCEYITGCDHIEIKPQSLHNGKTIEGHWFDVARIEILESSAIKLGRTATMSKQPKPKKVAKKIVTMSNYRGGGPADHPSIASDTEQGGRLG